MLFSAHRITPYIRLVPTAVCRRSEWLPCATLIHRVVQVALSKQSPYVKSTHRVSGLMVANHTSIRFLLDKCMRGFRKLYPKYYVDHYKDYSKFNDGAGNLVRDEFDDAAEVVQARSRRCPVLPCLARLTQCL